jgi:hypothetical protein
MVVTTQEESPMKKKKSRTKLQTLDASKLAAVVGGQPEPSPWIVASNPEPSPWIVVRY